MPMRFSIAKRAGYEPEEVDKYVESLESVVKGYKDKDAAIMNAIVSAQIAADGIISAAKEQAKTIVEHSVASVREISSSVSEQRRILDEFKKDYNTLVGKYLVDVNERDFLEIERKITALEDYYRKLGQERTAAEPPEGNPAEGLEQYIVDRSRQNAADDSKNEPERPIEKPVPNARRFAEPVPAQPKSLVYSVPEPFAFKDDKREISDNKPKPVPPSFFGFDDKKAD